MDVSLTREFEKLVERKVKSGRYQTASEVVCEALRVLEKRDRAAGLRLAELRKEIAKGLRSGKSVPFDVAGLKRAMRKRIAVGSSE